MHGWFSPPSLWTCLHVRSTDRQTFLPSATERIEGKMGSLENLEGQSVEERSVDRFTLNIFGTFSISLSLSSQKWKHLRSLVLVCVRVYLRSRFESACFLALWPLVQLNLLAWPGQSSSKMPTVLTQGCPGHYLLPTCVFLSRFSHL